MKYMIKIITSLNLLFFTTSCYDNPKKDTSEEGSKQHNENEKDESKKPLKKNLKKGDSEENSHNDDLTETPDWLKRASESLTQDANGDKKLQTAIDLYNKSHNGLDLENLDNDTLFNSYDALANNSPYNQKEALIEFNKKIFNKLIKRAQNEINKAKELHDNLEYDLEYKKNFAQAINKAENTINEIKNIEELKTLFQEITTAINNFSLADRMQAEAGYPIK